MSATIERVLPPRPSRMLSYPEDFGIMQITPGPLVCGVTQQDPRGKASVTWTQPRAAAPSLHARRPLNGKTPVCTSYWLGESTEPPPTRDRS